MPSPPMGPSFPKPPHSSSTALPRIGCASLQFCSLFRHVHYVLNLQYILLHTFTSTVTAGLVIMVATLLLPRPAIPAGEGTWKQNTTLSRQALLPCRITVHRLTCTQSLHD